MNLKAKVLYSAHAVTQMFKRGIGEEDIEYALNHGSIIMEYPDDVPYPSYLILGKIGERPLHVVYAINEAGDKIIITAYHPDKELWNIDFTEKRV